jgi:hypothetical protein
MFTAIGCLEHGLVENPRAVEERRRIKRTAKGERWQQTGAPHYVQT